MYFFRTFKKSTAPYKVHNMGLRYIIILDVLAPSFPVILLERELLGAWAAIVQNTEVKG